MFLILNTIPSQRCCPNCGTVGTGYRDERGILRLTCGRCGTVSVSKPKSRRHENMDVYAPKGEVLAEFCREVNHFGFHE